MQKILDFEMNGIRYHVLQFNGSSASVGTVKNVGAYETIEHAISQGANVVVNVTSGNNGEALKAAALGYNQGRPLEERVKVVPIIHHNPKMEYELEGVDGQFEYSMPYVFGEMETQWLTLQDRTKIAREFVEKRSRDNFQVRGVFDATHFIPNEYIRQAEEVLQSNGRQLDYLVIPVGTGRTFIAFYKALNNLQSRGISINTKLVGIVPKDENPIYNRFVFPERRKDGTLEYAIRNFSPKSIADKLSCPFTDLLPQLEQATTDGHIIIQIDDKAVKNANTYAFRLARNYGAGQLNLEDSGSVGFALADKNIAKLVGINKGDNVGIFVTGMGLYATPSWQLAQMQNERRRNAIKNFASKAALIAGASAIFLIPPYYLGRISPEEQMRIERSNQLYDQKKQLIDQIISYDDSMLMAADEIQKETGLYSQRRFDLILPDDVMDKIILRYLEKNKDKIQKADDPRDAAIFTQLRSLVIQSEQIEQMKQNQE